MTTRGPLLHTRRLRFVNRNFHRLFSLRCAGETRPSQVAAEEGMGNKDDLFEYTSGRWIYNERRRLAERHLVFNVDELKKAAATAVGRPVSEIRSIRKLAEGGFNRVFDISMKDGLSLLARLPYPSTMPQRLAVASEVATLAFVRACGIPAPRVLGYSAHDNPVGVEYILMEKLPGRPIGDAWFSLPEKDRLKVLHEIVTLEAKLFANSLPASGSIYFAHDLPPGTPNVPLSDSEGLCIGPYANLRWWFNERASLDIDRGPHNDPCLVLQAPAEKELAWIRTYGKPRFPFQRAYGETLGYKKQDPDEHSNSLLEYLQLAPYLAPTCPKLNLPILRHPDLQPNNIFISEDFKITGLIDWQHSLVLPMFLAAGIPRSFQNYGDEQSMYFIPPQLPKDLGSMDADEHAIACEQFRRRHVHFFYLGFTQKLNEPHSEALEQEFGLLRRRIFDNAGSPWEGLNTPLQVDIAQVSQNWSKIAAVRSDGSLPACPVVISEQDAQKRAALDDSLRDVDTELEQIHGFLGVGSDRWTSHELFEQAKERARSIKAEGLAAVDDDPWLRRMTEQHWPFDDYNEDE
ncbi:hypothetical protein D8B26_001048 [Coccidioides posadasii str. Silveira]|uniref:uncharacterized protein n=1 Tax=Coccidioides posadasii (strain RMSCC 757 / Silveira) TaxID=443226 RepID=UPI001BEDBD72|nr:hypothetical protein D8B26_001048 [Coccidioides posadasii str. Silveira]